MSCGVVTMVDSGVVDTVFVEEAVESVFVSVADCSLLLHDASERNNTPRNALEMVCALIIVVVFKIRKCRGGKGDTRGKWY
jgi:hypothetical protein